ncbi:MAG: hypothetical protein HYX81_04795 [Chloroflexi bacterium]|nr:hypothetical protein [Chloroflexota bacterium]
MKKNEKKVSDLTIEELMQFIEYAVDRGLEDYFIDPDAGLEVRPELIARLKSQRQSPKKLIPGEEILKRYGMKLEE